MRCASRSNRGATIFEALQASSIECHWRKETGEGPFCFLACCVASRLLVSHRQQRSIQPTRDATMFRRQRYQRWISVLEIDASHCVSWPCRTPSSRMSALKTVFLKIPILFYLLPATALFCGFPPNYVALGLFQVGHDRPATVFN